MKIKDLIKSLQQMNKNMDIVAWKLVECEKCKSKEIEMRASYTYLSTMGTTDVGLSKEDKKEIGPKILPAPAELHARLDEWWTHGADPFEEIEYLTKVTKEAKQELIELLAGENI